ncbi:MAG: hypothetical protein AAGF57_02320 [Pseudomonadota bacterium]
MFNRSVHRHFPNFFKLTGIALALIASGCATASFDPSKHIKASTGNQVGLFALGSDYKNSELTKIMNSFPDGTFSTSVSQMCKVPNLSPAVADAAVGLIAATGKFLFDRHQEKKLRELAKLKKAASGSYSGNVILPAASLKNISCLILIRYQGEDSGNNNKLGLVVAVQIEHHTKQGPTAITFRPTYLDARDAVVLTNRPNEKEGVLSKVNYSVALALKAIGTSAENGLPKLYSIGSGASTVPNVGLSASSKTCETQEVACPSSDLIPIVSGDVGPVSLSLGITETGHVGIDFEAVEAEIKAIKEAFGPAIEESLTTYLSDD